jgi:hypothetical protein
VGFGGLLVTAARAELQNSLDTDAQTLQLLPDDVFWHVSAKVLDQQPYTAVLREGESVKTHTLVPSRDRSALTVALKPSSVRGTSISFSPFIWADSPL